MIKYLPAAAILFFTASPAFATGGFSCDTTDGSKIALHATTGRVISNPIIGIVLIVDGKEYWTSGDKPALTILQSWTDDKQLLVDLADPNVERYEARLRTRITKSGAKGTLTYGGRKYPVKCEFE